MSVEAPHYLFHSFPRPRKDESPADALGRGLEILRSIKTLGLVLAPEVVEWDVDALSGGQEQLLLLQRRACFTEIPEDELARHAITFGPIGLAFDIDKLRLAGAMPVIYAPQGKADNPLSLMSTFAVRGAFHTHAVLLQLNKLKQLSDPATASAKFGGRPVASDYTLNLRNTDPVGAVVNERSVSAEDIKAIFDHVGYRNIPLEHSAGMLSLFMNLFYPTDNSYAGTRLGYYQQREWRLFGGGFAFNGRELGRPFTAKESKQIREVDPQFWDRQLMLQDGTKVSRLDLGLIYEPSPEWHPFDLVQAIYVSRDAADRVREIVGDTLAIVPMGS